MTPEIKTPNAKPQPYPLQQSTKTVFDLIKKELPSPGSKLGTLARRLETAARDIQQGIDLWGSGAIIGNVLGGEVKVPVQTSVEIRVTVKAGEAQKTYVVPLGTAIPEPGRPETPLTAKAFMGGHVVTLSATSVGV